MMKAFETFESFFFANKVTIKWISSFILFFVFNIQYILWKHVRKKSTKKSKYVHT